MTRNQRIKETMKASKITREMLADKLGVTTATITQRLNAEKDIDSWDFLVAVAALTNSSLHYLATGEESTKPDSLEGQQGSNERIESLERTVKTLGNIVETHKRLLDEYKKTQAVLMDKIQRYEQEHEKS